MEVACGEYGDCIPKLVMAVNSGKCNSLNQQQQHTASAIKTCVDNDIVKEDTDSKWNWSACHSDTNKDTDKGNLKIFIILTHWGWVTQICVFNMRLFSLHNILNL